MLACFHVLDSAPDERFQVVLESGIVDFDDRNSLVELFFATTAADGKQYNVAYYNLDMIICVGYRVNSHRGVQFRIWATQVLREYIVKGFALNDSYIDGFLLTEFILFADLRFSKLRVSKGGASHFLFASETYRYLWICRKSTTIWRMQMDI
ncbi:MAG: RhuM family protein [Fibrobacter sp.]|nr:RhuM family protein [Fibrobacter sp.]MDD5943987.1 RhuM family protein [Fibrobacter sp.]